MSFNKKLILFFFNIFIAQTVLAQQGNDAVIENILETIAENQAEDFDYSEIIETLNNYRRNPINLNKTTKEQLRELIFLNPIQINNLIEHVEINGRLIDVLELQSIDGFDLETIRNLLNFATISSLSGFENFSLNNLAKYGRNDLLVRYGRILESQAGYHIPDSTNKSRYLGSPDRIFTRYRFNFKNNIQFSLNMDKDAGEKLWNTTAGTPKGPDFLSSSLFIKDLYRFKKIVIGDYALQFGQGLTLWSGLSFGKGADIFSIAKQDLGLRAYTSINEFSFFRGISSQINFGKFDFTPFVSFRKLDAGSTLNQETNLEEATNFQISGLHRTPNELANKNRIEQFVYGGNLQFNHRKLSLGLTAYQSNYNQSFASSSTLYEKFDFTGKNLTNTGFNYSYTKNNFYFFGEAAHSINSGFAYINGIIASLTPEVSAIVFHRNYDKDYHSFYNQAIGESSVSTNEKGFYGGLQYKSGRKYEFSIYADLFKFPWLRFRVDAPSTGHEVLSQFTYAPNKVTKFIFRYKLEEKQQNASNTNLFTNMLEYVRKQNYRFEIQYKANKNFNLRNRAEIVQFKKQSTKNSFGYLIYQDIIYSPDNSRLSGNLRFALFETEGFDTRIYAYENDVLYGFSIPGFQNKGVRFYVNGRYNVKRGVDLWLKYSFTKYNDVETVGSGLDLIEGNLRSEIKLQLRYQF